MAFVVYSTPSFHLKAIPIQGLNQLGTDLHEYILGPLVVPRKECPHAITGEHLPVVLGHEFAGSIVKTSSTSDFKFGEKVMVDPRINCQSCYPCRTNIEQLCDSWGFVGLSGHGGGFSEFVAVSPRMCYRLPEDVNMDEAALIEPLSVGRHALPVSGFEDFSNLTVLIVGAGPIGVSVLWNLRVVGVKSMVVSEPTKLRQEQAKDLADKVLSPIDVNIGDECRKMTDGVGVDVVFDCAGIPAGMRAGMDALRPRGVYVNVSGWEQPVRSSKWGGRWTPLTVWVAGHSSRVRDDEGDHCQVQHGVR